MRLGYDLTIEQTQKLVMTPELIQAIQILQFNTQELSAYVQEQLLINPVLENVNLAPADEGEHAGDTGEKKPESESIVQEPETVVPERKEEKEEGCPDGLCEFDWREQIKERKDYDDISYRQWEYNKDDKEYSYEQFVTSDVTLSEHLLFQLQFSSLPKGCRKMGRYIVESLDDNGYMTVKKDEIARAFNTDIEKVEEVLAVIHGFEPIGVGAENLRECLIIQLDYMGLLDPIIESVIMEYLEDIASNRLAVIAKELSVSVQRVQEISDLIRKLEPKPGRQFASQSSTRYVLPDVVVEKDDGSYIVTVNETSTPRLMISSYYEKLLGEAEEDENLSKYLSGRINSAMWLIRSIEQRKHTIHNVVSAVVKYQEDFFEKGPKHLKTLTLKQIADEVGIHESTVSRSINGKYMQSPRGVFEIKYFFTSGVAGNQGEGISSESIKTFIKEMVDNEEPKAPCSDQDMVNMLAKRGIEISRRTVAKYRDEIGILSSSKRKRY